MCPFNLCLHALSPECGISVDAFLTELGWEMLSRVELGWCCGHTFLFVYLLSLWCPEEEKLACKMRLAIKTTVDTSLHPLLNYCTAESALETQIWMPTSFLTSRLIFFPYFYLKGCQPNSLSLFCIVAIDSVQSECYIQSNETATAFQK